MKKLNYLFIVLFAVLGLSSCSAENVTEGTEGVCIKRPYLFGSNGVEVLEPGRHFLALSTDVVPVNTKPVTYTESFQDLNTQDNVAVDFDIYFKFQVKKGYADTLYSNFGVSTQGGEQVWYINNLKRKLRNLTRDKCKEYDMNPLTNDAKISKFVEDFVLKEGIKYIAEIGIPVLLIDVSMGKVNPPKVVITERSKTAAAKQREKTINQETENERKRKLKEIERANADKAYQEQMGFTPTQYLQYLNLQNQSEMAKKTKSVINVVGGGNVSVLAQ